MIFIIVPFKYTLRTSGLGATYLLVDLLEIWKQFDVILLL